MSNEENIVKLLSLMSDDIYEIKQICLKARYNKSIKNAFIELILLSAEPIVKLYLLQYQKEGQEDGLYFNLEYLKLEDLNSLEKFKNSLTNIKEFAKFVTQIHGSIKYKDSSSIKRNFEQIIEDYRTYAKDLNPKLPMANINEQECLKDEEIDDFIEKQSLIVNKKLNNGLIICDRGINSVYEFEVQFQININPISHNAGEFCVNLVPIKERRDILLKYHIKPSAISFENFQFIPNHLANERQNANLEIQYPLWELVFEIENIAIPKKLIKDINDALECNNPIMN
ncbi:28620_t:CDS:2 [Dentiscutata erythropus]|uniref:28620_t:CDS:1 n=1 Tax=Dentiscutata erythropus TaxID=1348616 RepID=A0A9N9G7I7_9GLOM|nr:28620_t:CDS:2 [Dentiscutata erythropus]